MLTFFSLRRSRRNRSSAWRYGQPTDRMRSRKMERLECRHLLAATTLSLNGSGVLTYTGDGDANELTLSASGNAYTLTPGMLDTITIDTNLPAGVTSSGGGMPGDPATITGADADDITSVVINLLGGTDSVVIDTTNDPTSVDLGTETDTLRGPDSATSWVVSALDAGSFGDVMFNGVENLEGGSAQDDFQLNANVTGNVNGRGDNDQFQLGSGVSVGQLIGGGGAGDSLLGAAASNTWVVNATNAGTLNGQSFTEIENLTGGSMSDDFQLNDSIASVDGGSGSDQFQVAASATIGQLMGGDDSDTLIGNDTINTWSVNALNAGTLNGQDFSQIENLTGGTDVDTFTLDADITGTISGGDSGDVFNVNAAVTGSLNGGAGSDAFTVQADSLTGTVTLDGAG